MVESPVRIETRTKLIYTLSEASELEHGLTCCYLFAAFSMKGHTSEGITDAQLKAVRRWKRVIIEVAVQEMLHLALASNLLTAVGAAPHLRRPNLPSSPRAYPPAFQLALKPFSEESLKHFIFLERPEGITSERADLRPSSTRPRSRVPGSGVRGRGSGERETTASSLAGKEESSRKEDNSGQGKDGPAGAIAQGGNGR